MWRLGANASLNQVPKSPLGAEGSEYIEPSVAAYCASCTAPLDGGYQFPSDASHQSGPGSCRLTLQQLSRRRGIQLIAHSGRH